MESDMNGVGDCSSQGRSIYPAAGIIRDVRIAVFIWFAVLVAAALSLKTAISTRVYPVGAVVA